MGVRVRIKHQFVLGVVNARSRAYRKMYQQDLLDAQMIGLQALRAVTENA